MTAAMPHDPAGCDCGIWPIDQTDPPPKAPRPGRQRGPSDPWRPGATGGVGLRPERPCSHCRQQVRAVDDPRIGLLLLVEPQPSMHEQVDPRWPAWFWDDVWGLVTRERGGELRYPSAPLIIQHHCPARPWLPPSMRPATEPPPHPVPRERSTVTAPTFGTARPPGEGASNADLQGKLLLIKVTEKKTGFVTSSGLADVVVADVVDLTAGEEHPDNFLFGKVLFGQFELGVTYLGTIGKGVAKPGQSAPWLFTGAETDPAAVAQAQQYLAYKAQQAPAAPAPAAAPAAAPWAT